MFFFFFLDSKSYTLNFLLERRTLNKCMNVYHVPTTRKGGGSTEGVPQLFLKVKIYIRTDMLKITKRQLELQSLYIYSSG